MKTTLTIAILLYFLISIKFVSAKSPYHVDYEEDGEDDNSDSERDSEEDEFKINRDDVISVIGSMFPTRLEKEDLKVLSESLDEDNDGIISLADIEKVLKEYNITDSADAAMFLIEEVNARVAVGLPGRQRRVITFEKNKATIDEDAITRIILHPEVKHRKIVSLSIVGAFRKGKSFLLDYVLRYLYYTYTSINTINLQNKTTGKPAEWIGDPKEPLKGFSWKPGVSRNTTGIVFWSDVFLYDSDDGEKYAILIIDTQGLFDHDTPAAINAKIFSFTTLISSFQIFNLVNMIQEDHLEYLQFATEFSRFSLANNGDGKPFQNLLFLIRDWVNHEDYAFGYDGGQGYLNEAVFKIKVDHQKSMKRWRQFIKESFESIKAFLMPHPGPIVAGTKGFNGSWGVIDKEFVNQLKVLVPSMLAPENLAVKKIGGYEMTGEKLYQHMQFYLKLFSSNKIPSALTVYESTVTKFLQDLVSSTAALYRELMSNGTLAIETHSDFDILHLKSKEEAIDFYNNERKMGGNNSIVFYRNSLIGEIDKILNEQNNTMFLKIENIMRIRELEAQKNETLHEKQKVEELEKAQMRAELEANETMIEMQKNIERVVKKNEEIEILQSSLKARNDEIEDQRKQQEQREKEMLEEQARLKKESDDRIEEFTKQLKEKNNKVEEQEQRFNDLLKQMAIQNELIKSLKEKTENIAPDIIGEAVKQLKIWEEEKQNEANELKRLNDEKAEAAKKRLDYQQKLYNDCIGKKTGRIVAAVFTLGISHFAGKKIENCGHLNPNINND